MTEIELGGKAFLILIGAGAVCGVVSLWAFRHWSDSAKLRAASNRILAHLLEIRLFASEPALILKAQRDLIADNVRLLQAVTRPMLALLLPFAALFVGLDAFFGRAPLRTGQSTVVTVQCKGGGESMPKLRLTGTADIQVETPPVRIPREGQISWRVRPLRATVGELAVHCGERIVTKNISAESGLSWLSERRAGWAATLLHPFELPLDDPAIDSIQLQYPHAVVFHLHWSVWFLAGTFAGSSIFLLGGWGAR